MRIKYFPIILFMSIQINAQNSQVSWSSSNMGYTEPKAGNTIVKSVVGQVFVGITEQSNTQVIIGFLADTLFRRTVVDIKNQKDLPTSYSLWQNYPNPFNPTTIINYQLPINNWVTLKVYNVLGQEVATLVNEIREAGRYELQFDGSKLTSGVYFYRIQANGYINSKKFLLLK